MRLTVAVAAFLFAWGPVAAAEPAAADADCRPLLIMSAGTFSLADEDDYPYLVGVQYRAAPLTRWLLRPGIGIEAGPDDMVYLFADLARDFGLPRQWFVTLSVGGGWFANGEPVGAAYDLEFRTGLALGRRLASGARLGLAGHHISNASLDRPNNGTETLVLFLALPLGR